MRAFKQDKYGFSTMIVNRRYVIYKEYGFVHARAKDWECRFKNERLFEVIKISPKKCYVYRKK